MTKPTRKEIWAHNALLGSARRAELTGVAVLRAQTTTDEAKTIAVRLEIKARALMKALKKRRDQ